MSGNVFLPKKPEIEIEHSLGTAGTYTWIAPDKNRDGTDYQIDVALYGGGGGGGDTGDIQDDGQNGGAGAFGYGKLTVSPGSTYTLIVASGGGGSTTLGGAAGGQSKIQLLGSDIVTAGGGGGGADATTTVKVAASGAMTVNNGSLFSLEYDLGTFRRTINGDARFYIYFEAAGAYEDYATYTGGVGGNHQSTSASGTAGRVVMRYTLPNNVTDNTPV